MNIHIIEIKKRIYYCIFFFINTFITLFYYSELLFDIILIPIQKILSNNDNIISTNIINTLIIPLKLTIYISIILTIPFLIHNIWSFISPALYNKEKKNILPYIIYNTILIYITIILTNIFIIQIIILFFIKYSPINIILMIDISNYLNFIIYINISTCISSQIPIITHILIKLKILKKKTLIKKRKYIFILCFIVGMIITPPDVISQILISIPIWLLFEIGIFFSK